MNKRTAPPDAGLIYTTEEKSKLKNSTTVHVPIVMNPQRSLN